MAETQTAEQEAKKAQQKFDKLAADLLKSGEVGDNAAIALYEMRDDPDFGDIITQLFEMLGFIFDTKAKMQDGKTHNVVEVQRPANFTDAQKAAVGEARREAREIVGVEQQEQSQSDVLYNKIIAQMKESDNFRDLQPLVEDADQVIAMLKSRTPEQLQQLFFPDDDKGSHDGFARALIVNLFQKDATPETYVKIENAMDAAYQNRFETTFKEAWMFYQAMFDVQTQGQFENAIAGMKAVFKDENKPFDVSSHNVISLFANKNENFDSKAALKTLLDAGGVDKKEEFNALIQEVGNAEVHQDFEPSKAAALEALKEIRDEKFPSVTANQDQDPSPAENQEPDEQTIPGLIIEHGDDDAAHTQPPPEKPAPSTGEEDVKVINVPPQPPPEQEDNAQLEITVDPGNAKYTGQQNKKDDREEFYKSPYRGEILKIEELLDGRGWRNEEGGGHSKRFNGITNNYRDHDLVKDAIDTVKELLGNDLTEELEAMIARIEGYNKAGTFVSSTFATEASKLYRERLPEEGKRPTNGEYAEALLRVLDTLDDEDAFTFDTAGIDEHLTADQKQAVTAEAAAIGKFQANLRSNMGA